METTEDKQPLPCPDHREYDLNLPSSLTQFGIDAMRWWESLPKAGIYMGRFRVRGRYIEHLEGFLEVASNSKSIRDTCFACCGGAARCAVEGWTPENFQMSRGFYDSENSKLNDLEVTLDFLREGDLSGAFYELDLEAEEGERYSRDITDYHRSPELFYQDMEQLVDDLKAGGY